MKTSEQINEIAAALAKAQSEMSNPTFDAQNPHFKNRFATLAAVRNAVIPALSKHGIALTQDIEPVESGIASTTHLLHQSGQWLHFGPMVMPVSKQDAQGFGSAATYCKRYQLMAVCGVVGDDDDDAEQAVGRETNPQSQPKRGPSQLAKEYVKRFTEAFEIGEDQPILGLNQELQEDTDIYREVWGMLPSGMRRQIKDIIDRSKAA